MPPFLRDTGSQSLTNLIDRNASMKMKEKSKIYPAPCFPKSIVRSRVTAHQEFIRSDVSSIQANQG